MMQYLPHIHSMSIVVYKFPIHVFCPSHDKKFEAKECVIREKVAAKVSDQRLRLRQMSL